MKTTRIREWTTLWGLKCTKIPRDLVFYPAWPIFKLDLDIILIQHLTKFGEHRMKTTWIGERTLITDGSKDRQTDQPTSSLLYTPLNFVFGGIIKAKKSLPDLVTFCVLCFNVLFFIFLLGKWSFALNKGFFVDNKVFSPDNVLGVSYFYISEFSPNFLHPNTGCFP